MNLLQMMQFVQGNIGTSSDLPFNGPSTVVGVTGQYLEFLNFIFQAYKDIQLLHEDWRFRQKKGYLTLNVGQNIYTLGQVRAQITDYEDVAYLHFIDDARYALVANPLTNQPVATTTKAPGVTLVNGTYFVPVTNVSTFSPNNGTGINVNITDGTNSILAPLLGVNGTTFIFAADQATTAGTPTSIANGSPVTYPGNTAAPDISTQRFCYFYTYQDYRGWLDRQTIPNGVPVRFTKDPNESLEFQPIPDQNYSIFFDYVTQIDVMTQTDASTPKYLHARFHEVICWKAIMYWSQNPARQNGAVYQAALNEYKRILNKMEQTMLPDIQPYLQEYFG